MKTIITIQHTQSVHHTNGMIGSTTDWSLSDLGKIQAKCIGENLAKELKEKSVTLYTSDLLRAKQTAEIIGESLKSKPNLRVELRERHLGSAVGKSVAWLKENQLPYQDHVDHKYLADAESRREVWVRLDPFLNEIINSDDEYIVIVSHGDTLSVFNAMWLGLQPEALNQLDLFGMSGGVSFFYENENQKRVIKRLSDQSYLLHPTLR